MTTPQTIDKPTGALLPFSSLQSFGRVYAFLDLDHPAVAWAVMRGMLVSADYAAEEAGFISFMQAGIILYGNNPRIFNEAIIDVWRAKYFPKQVSRMRGIYFFGSYSEAEARIGDSAWPSYFTPDNLLELELISDKLPSRIDANWITFARLNNDGRIALDDLTWISRYWAGEPYNEEPVWEIIANGVALIFDERVRRRCNSYLEELFPRAHIPILMARLASEVGTRGGLVHPFLLREDSETVRLGYLWSDAEFHGRDVIERIKQHPDSGKLGKMMSANETWNAPDFRPWSRLYKLELRPIPQLGGLAIPSVHDNVARHSQHA